jgi:hypothetical protein
VTRRNCARFSLGQLGEPESAEPAISRSSLAARAASRQSLRVSSFEPTTAGADGPALQIGDFDRVDTTDDPDRYVRWMDRQRGSHTDRALTELDLHGSDVVLDVGCGTGIDLASIQARHSPYTG